MIDNSACTPTNFTREEKSALVGELAYCTVTARNYLPQVLALNASVRRFDPAIPLFVLVIDGSPVVPAELCDGIVFKSPEELEISSRELLNMKTSYTVVEYATGLKPKFLDHLLERFEQVVYLDPDTYLTASLEPLGEELARSAKGLLLTPHFLEAIEPGSASLSEVHSLTVGVCNLGFCAVDRRAKQFLIWWWSHLRTECLIYPLLGIFVDQKWVDIGAVLYSATYLRDYGFNVGPWNLHERELSCAGEEIRVGAGGDLLRFFHFSGFDLKRPHELSERLNFSTEDLRRSNRTLDELCNEYGSLLADIMAKTGPQPAYAFAADTSGRKISTRERRAYRAQALQGASLPSPFAPSEARAYAAWRKKATALMMRQTAGDLAIALKYAMPDRYAKTKQAAPGWFRNVRVRLLQQSEIRR